MSFITLHPKTKKRKTTIASVASIVSWKFFWIPKLMTRRELIEDPQNYPSHHNGPQGLHWDLRLQQGWSHSEPGRDFFRKKAQRVGWSWYDPGDAIIDVCESLGCSKKNGSFHRNSWGAVNRNRFIWCVACLSPCYCDVTVPCFLLVSYSTWLFQIQYAVRLWIWMCMHRLYVNIPGASATALKIMFHVLSKWWGLAAYDEEFGDLQPAHWRAHYSSTYSLPSALSLLSSSYDFSSRFVWVFGRLGRSSWGLRCLVRMQSHFNPVSYRTKS